jgi:hypothetical protein
MCLLAVFPCCDVRYEFRIKTMLGSSLPLVVCMGFMSFLRYVCVLAHSGVIRISLRGRPIDKEYEL